MQILGIHLDPPFIRLALIRKGRKGIEVQSLDERLLDENEEDQNTTPKNGTFFGDPSNNLNVKRQYTTPKNGTFFGDPTSLNVKRLYILSGMPAKNILIRPLALKIPNRRHIEEAIAFQSEATSHFDPKQILTLPLVQNIEKGTAEVLLFTAPREALKEHLDELARLGFDPDEVGASPLALCDFICWKRPELQNVAIIHLGYNETICAQMEKGQLKRAHSLDIGVDDLLAALHEDRKKILLKKEVEGAAKQIDLLLLKPGFNPCFSECLERLQKELLKILYAFSPGEKISVVFTGMTDAFIHFREFLVPEFEDCGTREEQKFAIALGLGIKNRTVQLRQEEFFPKKNWQRMGKYALALFASCSLLSGALFGLWYRSSHLRKAEMLHSIGISEFDSAEQKIDDWISSIERNDKEYPYIIQAPRVIDVFSWLSAHPLLQQFKEEGDPLDLRELHYQLVTMPKIDTPEAPYLVKVEMEFQLAHPINARKFHESLRNGNQGVNRKLEITWEALDEGYRASFFLKNRGAYVP